MLRLDKILSNLGYGTRKEVKALIKKGCVEIDGRVANGNNDKVDPYKSSILVNGKKIVYREYIYLMMNKPSGVISATYDNRDETVVDLLEYEDSVFKPFPVGRLDKDTVGLLLLTNDGELNHKLISPKWHVDKIYYAEINKAIDDKDIEKFEKGIKLDDGYECFPAKLEIIESKEEQSKVRVTIHEGKFHQVKRMFESLEKKVTYLKREKMGDIPLDEALQEGEYRELTDEEVKILKNN